MILLIKRAVQSVTQYIHKVGSDISSSSSEVYLNMTMHLSLHLSIDLTAGITFSDITKTSSLISLKTNSLLHTPLQK